jgi:hypothetical protein
VKTKQGGFAHDAKTKQDDTKLSKKSYERCT